MTARAFENWTPESVSCPRCGVLLPGPDVVCSTCMRAPDDAGRQADHADQPAPGRPKPSPAASDHGLAGARVYAGPAGPGPAPVAPPHSYLLPPIPRRSSPARRVLPALLVLAVVAVGVVLLWNRHRASTAAHADPCVTAIPVGAAPAAAAYLNAVAAATPGWEKVDQSLQHEQNITHADDVLAQLRTDTSYLNSLQSIDFPPQAADDAATFEAAVQTYLDFLTNAAADPSYLAQNASEDFQVNEARAEAAAHLRADLGLPPSSCTFRRP